MFKSIAVLSVLSVFTSTIAFGQDLKSDDPRSLILNGGFEDQTAAPWELKSDGGKAATLELDSTEHFVGGQAARLEFIPNASDSVVVEQALKLRDLPTGGSFRVVASCKVKNPPQGQNDYHFGVSFTVTYEDGSKKWESGFPGSFFDRASGEWQTVDFLWTPEKPVSSVKLRLVVPAEAEVAWIDEVAMIPLNE